MAAGSIFIQPPGVIVGGVHVPLAMASFGQ